MAERALLYARVSSDDRHRDGRNLEGQLRMAREYAQGKGYEVVYELAEDDRGASGARIDLPELQKAIRLAQDNAFDVFIVRELDRLSRNLAKQLVVERELQDAGARIEYVLGEYHDTPEGRLNKHIRAVIAEYEREKIKQRMVRGKRQAVRAGQIVLTRPPYGYDKKEVDGDTQLVINEHEAGIVRMMFEWYTAEGESLRGIAEKLTELGIERPSGGKEPWSHSSVGKILENESCIGNWYFGQTKWIDGKHVEQPRENWIKVDVPSIVSVELFERAQERRGKNAHLGVWQRKHKYLMAGRVKCALCGDAYAAQTVYSRGKPYPYYYHRYYSDCEWKGRFRVEDVDGASWEWVKSILLDPEALRAGLQAEQEEREAITKPLRDRLNVVDGLLQENSDRLDKLLDLYLDGSFSKDILTDRREHLQTTIDALESERNELARRVESESVTDAQVEAIEGYARTMGEGLEIADADFDTKRRIIDLLDVNALLSLEDGDKVIYLTCLLGEKVYSMSNISGSPRL